MEHLNPERKPLSELFLEAAEKKMDIVLIEEPEIDGHHRIAALIGMDEYMVIRMSNIIEEDHSEVARLMTIRDSLKNAPSLKFENTRRENLDIDKMLNDIRQSTFPCHTVPIKNHKPYQNNQRYLPKKNTGFRGRR